MNKFYHRYRFYPLVMGGITLIATILRTVAAAIGVDEYGYFTNSVLSEVSAWLIVAGAIFMFSYPIFARGSMNVLPAVLSPLSYLPSAALCFVLIFLFAEHVPNALLFLRRQYISTVTFCAFLIALFAALAVIYFACYALIETRYSDKRALYGMAAVLLFGTYAAYLYFDTTLPLNAHTKIADQMAYVFLALFFLYEVRASLGRERWKLYTIFGFIAGMLCAYSAIPSFLIYLFTGRLLNASLAETLTTLAALVFITLRLLLLDRIPENCPIPLVVKLTEAANIREQTVSEVENVFLPKATDSDIAPEAPEADVSQTLDVSSNGNEAISEETAAPAAIASATDATEANDTEEKEELPDNASINEGTEAKKSNTIDTEDDADEAKIRTQAESSPNSEAAAGGSESAIDTSSAIETQETTEDTTNDDIEIME